jgi:hypothetical protein
MLLPQEADRRILSQTQPFTIADTETIALTQCQGLLSHQRSMPDGRSTDSL